MTLPLIIKEKLGEEVYDMMNKAIHDNRVGDRTIDIWTSAKGEQILNDAIKQEYDKSKGNS